MTQYSRLDYDGASTSAEGHDESGKLLEQQDDTDDERADGVSSEGEKPPAAGSTEVSFSNFSLDDIFFIIFSVKGRHKRSRYARATVGDSYHSLRCCYSRDIDFASEPWQSHAWSSARNQPESDSLESGRESGADDGR